MVTLVVQDPADELINLDTFTAMINLDKFNTQLPRGRRPKPKAKLLLKFCVLGLHCSNDALMHTFGIMVDVSI